MKYFEYLLFKQKLMNWIMLYIIIGFVGNMFSTKDRMVHNCTPFTGRKKKKTEAENHDGSDSAHWLRIGRYLPKSLLSVDLKRKQSASVMNAVFR